MQAICLILLLMVVIAFGFADIGSLLELKKSVQKDPSGLVVASPVSRSLASDRCPYWHGVLCSKGNVH